MQIEEGSGYKYYKSNGGYSGHRGEKSHEEYWYHNFYSCHGSYKGYRKLTSFTLEDHKTMQVFDTHRGYACHRDY